ncbi:MAG TPA: BatA domain-containing protein [Humisphaera sp.]|jgi:hypothetical protein|nr:BatA domain-containing protein [Humisphaera sp.]
MPFSFLTPAFAIAGLLLMALPIIIHLLNRRRFKTVSWAAMEFLLRAMRKNRRRLRFEQLLLLATRCLLLLLLGMALARPLGCENSALAKLGRRTSLNVYVIDTSYSMAYEVNQAGAKTHLDQAKQLVKKLLSRPSSGGESAVIIAAGKPATAVVGKPQFDMEEAKSAIDRIEQSYDGTDLAGALDLALKVAKEEINQPNKNLFIVTDATRGAWESSQAQAIKLAGPELAKYFHITHFNLSSNQQQWNAAVLDITPSSNLVSTKFPVDFKADVKGFGPSHDGTLQWKLDDQLLESGAIVHLDSTTPGQVQSKARFATGGPHVISVQLNDEDHLSVDNTRHRVLDVAAELNVLIVEGKRGNKLEESAGGLLAQALSTPAAVEPGKPPRNDGIAATDLITDFEFGNKVLSDYSAVVLADVATVTVQEADAIANYVKKGGTLMLFMGDSVDRQNYNTVLLPRKLLPGPLVKNVLTADDKPFYFDFKPTGVLHPYLNVFANQEKTGLDTAPFTGYIQTEIDPKLGVERVLNYLPPDPKTPGDPAITVHSLEQGRVVFYSSTANSDWSKSFSSKPAYLELMCELLGGSVKMGDGWLNLLVDQPLEIPQSVRVTSAPVLTDPSGLPVIVDPQTREGRIVYTTAPLKKPGLYKLSLGDKQMPVAVNVPANEEANVTTITDDAIRHAMGDAEVSLQGGEVPMEAAAGREGNDFSWWCMMLVLALVCFECFIAMKFGHYHRSEAPVRPSAAA